MANQQRPDMLITRGMVDEYVRFEAKRLALSCAPRLSFLARKDVAFSAERQKDGTWTVNLGGHTPPATGLEDWLAVEDFVLEMLSD